MIENDDQLQRTREALSLAEAALAALHRRKADMDPAWFALMAEPVLDQIRQLRAQIDDYIGLTDATNAVAAVGANAGEKAGGEQ
ncbi:MAG TPA: hypothetical protein VGF55_09035 [Gemmataceae bacterium]